MVASKDSKTDLTKQDAGNVDSYKIEEHLLTTIKDLASRRAVSRHELASSIGEQGNAFTIKMWLLTLEGRGFIKITESGYVLTNRGWQRLQNKI